MAIKVDDIAATLPPVGAEGTYQSNGTSGGASQRSEASSKRNIDLPLPEGQCLSLWLQTVRNNPLLDHRTTEQLPQEADVVIIGSGISGSLTALSLLQSPTPPSSVVVLEARELCSGATGRNAGHCKPDQWRGFTKYKQLFGTEQSIKVLKNEQATWEALVAYVRKHQVDCDLWVGKTLDVPMTPGVAEVSAKNFADYKAAGGKVDHIEVITEPAEAEKRSRLKGAQAVYAWDASTLHPWKLVAHVVQTALDLGLNLQTWTPATAITGSEGRWEVHTDRGVITTPTVVHATNAYAGHLLPETKGVISPTPHMCNKVLPPASFAGSKALQNSYAVLFPDGLYSINPRRAGDGIVLFGGSAPNQKYLNDYVNSDPAHTTDDSLTNFEPVTDAVRKLGTENFQWDSIPGQSRGNAVRYDYAWSGIIGKSADQVPYVGAVPGKPGQWMSAGHNGHGMARIFTCAPALAKMIQGASWAETGLPECFQVSKERLDRLRG